jgi:hypothetical protein
VVVAGVVAVGVVTAEEVAREVARDEAIDLNPPTARELNLPFASPRRPESRRRPAGSKPMPQAAGTCIEKVPTARRESCRDTKYYRQYIVISADRAEHEEWCAGVRQQQRRARRADRGADERREAERSREGV